MVNSRRALSRAPHPGRCGAFPSWTYQGRCGAIPGWTDQGRRGSFRGWTDQGRRPDGRRTDPGIAEQLDPGPVWAAGREHTGVCASSALGRRPPTPHPTTPHPTPPPPHPTHPPTAASMPLPRPPQSADRRGVGCACAPVWDLLHQPVCVAGHVRIAERLGLWVWIRHQHLWQRSGVHWIPVLWLWLWQCACGVQAVDRMTAGF